MSHVCLQRTSDMITYVIYHINNSLFLRPVYHICGVQMPGKYILHVTWCYQNNDVDMSLRETQVRLKLKGHALPPGQQTSSVIVVTLFRAHQVELLTLHPPRVSVYTCRVCLEFVDTYLWPATYQMYLESEIVDKGFYFIYRFILQEICKKICMTIDKLGTVCHYIRFFIQVLLCFCFTIRQKFLLILQDVTFSDTAAEYWKQSYFVQKET